MTKNDAVALIHAVHDLRKLNDPAEIIHLFQDDAEFCIIGTPREGSIAMRSSAGSIRATVEAMVSQWHWIDVDFISIMADGDQIVSRYILTARHVPTDTVLKTEAADFITVRDGKVASMHQFFDTAHVAATLAGQA